MSDPQKPTVIDEIEAAMVEALAARLGSTFYIAGFPARPGAFDTAGYEASALVHFNEGRYESTADTSGQARALQFIVVLILNRLEMASDAYRHLEAVRHALQFQAFAGAKPMRMVSEKLAGEQNGRWEWHVTVATSVPAAAAIVERSVRPVIPPAQKREAA